VLSRRWLMMSLAALTLALAIGAVVQLRRG